MVNTSSKQSDISLEHYLKELSHSHPLSAAEEFELAVKMKRGDLKARNSLIKANLRFVVNVALKYRNQGQAIADKYGLTRERVRQIKEKALRKLRHPSRGRKLIAYAEAG